MFCPFIGLDGSPGGLARQTDLPCVQRIVERAKTKSTPGKEFFKQMTKNSRGDKTAIELFTASVAAWDSGLRRRFAGLAA
jgi:hypothetical protein